MDDRVTSLLTKKSDDVFRPPVLVVDMMVMSRTGPWNRSARHCGVKCVLEIPETTRGE
jgi:hypothetical protein